MRLSAPTRLERVAPIDEIVRADKGAQLCLQFVRPGYHRGKGAGVLPSHPPPQAEDSVCGPRDRWSLAASGPRPIPWSSQTPTPGMLLLQRARIPAAVLPRSEEHTSELQSLR